MTEIQGLKDMKDCIFLVNPVDIMNHVQHIMPVRMYIHNAHVYNDIHSEQESANRINIKACKMF